VNDTELASEADALVLSRLTEQFHAPETILLVEDEAFVREITCEILEDAGYRVLKVCNATEAKAVFQRHGKTVKLLLTDVVLPGQNGRELANELRTTNSGLSVIFISGYPENVVTHTCGEADRTFYLPKPFSAESLLRKVSQLQARDSEEIA
jgi:two-component system, cell cycle sensor histidine kinase and response regulator CckA